MRGDKRGQRSRDGAANLPAHVHDPETEPAEAPPISAVTGQKALCAR
jgi:hypothetical protein